MVNLLLKFGATLFHSSNVWVIPHHGVTTADMTEGTCYEQFIIFFKYHFFFYLSENLASPDDFLNCFFSLSFLRIHINSKKDRVSLMSDPTRTVYRKLTLKSVKIIKMQRFGNCPTPWTPSPMKQQKQDTVCGAFSFSSFFSGEQLKPKLKLKLSQNSKH